MDDPLTTSVRVTACLLLFGLFTACTAPQAPEQAARAEVTNALEKALGNSSLTELSIQTRWNPTACDAPEWQVMLWGVWIRAELKGIEDSARIDGTVSRQLRATRSHAVDDRGWKYPIFEVVE
jgi:hypothetical protein